MGSYPSELKGNSTVLPSLAERNDSDLITAALAGQAECFTALIDRHGTAVRVRIQAIVREAADVDDLIQEVLLKAWLHLSSFRAEATFRTWITRIAINEALQWHRRQRRRPCCSFTDDTGSLESPIETPHQHADRRQAITTVQKAVGEMHLHHRQVLTLCDLEEISAPDAAKQLKLSLAAVKTRLFRARRLLAATLQKSQIRARLRPGARPPSC